MDLAKIRAGLALVGKDVGWDGWDFEPDDPQQLPCMVVGGIRRMVRVNRVVTEIDIVITFYASTADTLDATRTIDAALSVATGGKSYVDALEAVQPGVDTSYGWTSARFSSAGPYQRYSMPGGLVALGCEAIFTLTG